MPIDIKGLPKVDVLLALFNGAVAGALHGGYKKMALDREDAEAMLEDQHYFDYVNGRALHVDISGDFLMPVMYDNCNGQHAAARALAPLIEARERSTDAGFAAQVGAMAGLEVPRH